MKKLLSILGSFVVLTGTASGIVSCGTMAPNNSNGISDAVKKQVNDYITNSFQNFTISGSTTGSITGYLGDNSFKKILFNTISGDGKAFTGSPETSDQTIPFNFDTIYATAKLGKSDDSKAIVKAIEKASGDLSSWLTSFIINLNLNIKKTFSVFNNDKNNIVNLYQQSSTSLPYSNYNGLNLDKVVVKRTGSSNISSLNHLISSSSTTISEIYSFSIPVNYTITFPGDKQNSNQPPLTSNINFTMTNSPESLQTSNSILYEYVSYAMTGFLTDINGITSGNKSQNSYNFTLDPRDVTTDTKDGLDSLINSILHDFALDPIHTSEASIMFLLGLNQFIHFKSTDASDPGKNIYSTLDSANTSLTDGKSSIFSDNIKDINPSSTDKSQNMVKFSNFVSNSSKNSSNYENYYNNNINPNSNYVTPLNINNSKYFNNSSGTFTLNSKNVDSDINGFSTDSNMNVQSVPSEFSFLNLGKIEQNNGVYSGGAPLNYVSLGDVAINLSNLTMFGINLGGLSNIASLAYVRTSPDTNAKNGPILNINFLFSKDFYDIAIKNYEFNINAFFDAYTWYVDKYNFLNLAVNFNSSDTGTGATPADAIRSFLTTYFENTSYLETQSLSIKGKGGAGVLQGSDWFTLSTFFGYNYPIKNDSNLENIYGFNKAATYKSTYDKVSMPLFLLSSSTINANDRSLVNTYLVDTTDGSTSAYQSDTNGAFANLLLRFTLGGNETLPVTSNTSISFTNEDYRNYMNNSLNYFSYGFYFGQMQSFNLRFIDNKKN